MVPQPNRVPRHAERFAADHDAARVEGTVAKGAVCKPLVEKLFKLSLLAAMIEGTMTRVPSASH